MTADTSPTLSATSTRTFQGLFVGLSTIDVLYPMEGFPQEDHKHYSQAQLIQLGGPATNAAITFAALGGQATLVSAIGCGSLSQLMKDRLQGYGVRHLDLAPDYPGDPIISSIVSNTRNGSRTIFSARSDLPASATLEVREMPAFDVLCLDGFQSSFAHQLLVERDMSGKVVFDGGSYKPQADRLLPFVDYPIFSERFVPPQDHDLHTYLQQHRSGPYAVTRGARPIDAYLDGHRFALGVPMVQAIDTLAAGDIFHGAFSYFIIQTGLDFREALVRSSEVAAASCQYLGARAWIEHDSKRLQRS